MPDIHDSAPCAPDGPGNVSPQPELDSPQPEPEVSPSAITAPGTGLIPDEAPGEEAVRRLMEEVQSVSVSDLLDLAARHYRRLLEGSPEDLVHAAGYEYMAERASAQADLFRDVSDSARCVLDGRASGVDLIRGLRVLAARHPVREGRELCASLANCCCIVLSTRLGGIPVDMDPALESPGGTARTLYIWHQQVMRASRAAFEISRSRGQVKSLGGLAMIGKVAAVRARLVVEFQLQGMGELGILIDHVGLPVGAPGPNDRPEALTAPAAS